MCCSCGGGSGNGNGCTDTTYGATDVTYDDCSWYDAYPDSCGYWDDEDFSSNDMCCACGGGNGCSNTNYGATDVTYDDCTWYDAWPSGCGIWDDEDFSSMDMCCACGGGYGCAVNLRSYYDNWWSTDLTNDGCDWYDEYPSGCDFWNDDDFTASVDCQACGGGYCEDTGDITGDTWGDGCDWYAADPAGRCTNGLYDWDGFHAHSDCCACEAYDYWNVVNLHEEACYDTDVDYQTDSEGDYCFWYVGNEEWCGWFDDDDFFAEELCCACDGGSSTTNGSCFDTNDYATDVTYDGCEWYDSYPEGCGLWDDDDFSSNDMCCSCLGGYWQGQCYDEAYGFVDWGGDDCSWYEDNALDCGIWDTEDFDAEDMCCACGGGTDGGKSQDLWAFDDDYWVWLSGKMTPKQQYAMYGAGIIALLAVIGYALNAKKKDEVKVSQNESLISTPQVY